LKPRHDGRKWFPVNINRGGGAAVNKSQMVNRIAHNHKLSKREATRVVTTFCDGVSNSLKRGATVQLAGFGSFAIRQGGGFTARNPRTGVGRKVAPYKQVVFTPASSWNPNRTKRRSKSGRSKSYKY
jgi:DNA-binding protein HU-beta